MSKDKTLEKPFDKISLIIIFLFLSVSTLFSVLSNHQDASCVEHCYSYYDNPFFDSFSGKPAKHILPFSLAWLFLIVPFVVVLNWRFSRLYGYDPNIIILKSELILLLTVIIIIFFAIFNDLYKVLPSITPVAVALHVLKYSPYFFAFLIVINLLKRSKGQNNIWLAVLVSIIVLSLIAIAVYSDIIRYIIDQSTHHYCC
jgi:hypothetical protein